MQNFNSIKVRLKLDDVVKDNKGVVLFQFHKGTIKTDRARFSAGAAAIYFNSIKVRLKLIVYVIGSLMRQFQFHKGTIKTRC